MTPARRSLWIYGLWLLGGALAACGGGGGETSPPASTPTFQTSPLLAATVPAQARMRVSSILSATAEANPTDAGLAVPTGTSTGDSPVIAISQAGDVLLMQFVQPGQTPSLDAATTATAMARIAVGSIVTSSSIATTVNAAIAGAPEFSNLQSLVLQALQAGTAPVNSTPVLTSLSVLVPQVQGVLANELQLASSTKSPLRVHVQATTPPPLPYVLLPGGVFSQIQVVDNPGNSGVGLKDDTYVTWSARITSLDGSPDGSAVILPSLSLLGSTGSLLTGKPVIATTNLPASSNQFVVGVAFDRPAQVRTFATFIANTASIALSTLSLPTIEVLPSCVADSLGALLNVGVAQLATAPSYVSISNYYLSFYSTPVGVYNTISAAAGCAGVAAVAKGTFLGSFGKFISAIQLLVTTTETAYGINQYFSYISANPPLQPNVEICKSTGNVIIACLLNAQAPGAYLAVGQSEQLNATNALGKPVTTGLTWSVFPASTSATVTSTGVVTAELPGSFTVQVSNQYADVGVTTTINSYVPAISPQNTSVELGGSLQLKLQDPSGRAVALDPSWNWSTTSPFIAVDPNSGLVVALAVGDSAVVSATDPVTGTVARATLNVSTIQANPDSFSMLENGSLTISQFELTSNDLDPAGLPLTVTSVQMSANGTATLGDSVTFIPLQNFTGLASFSYTVTDSEGATATSSVRISVKPPIPTFSGFTTKSFDAGAGETGLDLYAVLNGVPTYPVTFQVCYDFSLVGPYQNLVQPYDCFTYTESSANGEFDAQLFGESYSSAGGYHGPFNVTIIFADGTSTSLSYQL
jgi:hypothetical protein